jgi:hypothetical protein
MTRPHNLALVRIALAMTVFCVGFWPARGHATTDSGRSAVLLGTFDSGNYAVILESCVQTECSEGNCYGYVVKTKTRAFRKIGYIKIPTGANARAVIQKKLPKRLAKLMKRSFRSAKKSKSIKLVASKLKGKKRYSAKHGASRFTLSLVNVTRVPSMRAASRNKAAHCRLSGKKREALCSTCKATVIKLGGQAHKTYRCKKGLGKVATAMRPGAPKVACDCFAWARVRRLDVTRVEGKRRAISRGESLLLAPYMMGQNHMGQPAVETVDVELSLTAGYRMGNGRMLFVGAVVHAPQANGSYFPIVAVSQPLIRPF